jgi:hypothetical protein
MAPDIIVSLRMSSRLEGYVEGRTEEAERCAMEWPNRFLPIILPLSSVLHLQSPSTLLLRFTHNDTF